MDVGFENRVFVSLLHERKSRVSEEHPLFHHLSKMLPSCKKAIFQRATFDSTEADTTFPTKSNNKNKRFLTLTASTGFRWCRTNGFEALGLAIGKPQEREVFLSSRLLVWFTLDFVRNQRFVKWNLLVTF